MKFLLNVPYDEKDIVKRRGAKWDPVKKIWYVIDPVKPELFFKWMTIPNYLFEPTSSEKLYHPPFKVTQQRSKKKKRH